MDKAKELLKNKLVQALLAIGVVSGLGLLGLSMVVAEKLCPAQGWEKKPEAKVEAVVEPAK